MKVLKTYKNFIGGAYVRGESGRVQAAADGSQLPVSSRKDLRNAVEAASKAQAGWAVLSGYSRGQVLYRMAELLSGRAAEFACYLAAEGETQAERQVQASVERLVYLAGWTDKYAQLLSSVNPVAGPYYVASSPEPIGVVAVMAAREAGLLSLVSQLGSALATGNSVVALSGDWNLARLSLAEVLQASDLPAGAANLLAGDLSELAPVAASHREIGAVDLGDLEQREVFYREGAGNLKRLIEPERDWHDPTCCSPAVLDQLCETKTVWHPLGY